MKRIPVLAVTVALSMWLVMAPVAALAETTDITGQVAETPTVSSVGPNTGNAGTAPTVTITGTNFLNGQTTVNVDGAGVSAGAVTFTSSTSISATFTIAAGAAAGARNVSVIVAGKTSNAVAFTVNSGITVSPPSAINLGLMIAGATTHGSSATSGNVTANGSWQVTAKDEKSGANAGKMVNGGSTPLSAKFQVSKDDTAFANAENGVSYSGGSGVTQLPFYVSQNVTQSDAGGTYTITVTFTASVGG